jgi:DNA-binding NtrC family response regulator
LVETGTVLIAVKDTVLGDSLRFSLELEGYAARLCAPPFDAADVLPRTCLLLDQDVFAGMVGRGDREALLRLRLPTVLMVNQSTPRLMEHARAAGVVSIVEKPLLGGVLFETIRKVLEADGALGQE